MNYDKLVNRTLADMKPSGIRKFFDIAAEMEEVISLSVGEPDFATPWHIRQEGIKTLERGRTWYSPNAGLLSLRQAIGGYLNRRFDLTYDPKSEILVTVGGSEAIDLCFRALITPGDEVLIPEPSFVCYDPLTRMAGGVPVALPTRAEEAFLLHAAQVAEENGATIITLCDTAGIALPQEIAELVAKVKAAVSIPVYVQVSDHINMAVACLYCVYNTFFCCSVRGSLPRAVADAGYFCAVYLKSICE